MSGGHFNYTQYQIGYIVDEIEQIIRKSQEANAEDWLKFQPYTIEEFCTALKLLRRAQVYAQRIDWLVSGDDGEESFHQRLAEDLREVELLENNT